MASGLVKKIVLGSALLVGSTALLGCSPYGNSVRDNLGHHALNTGVSTIVEEFIKKEFGHSDYQEQVQEQVNVSQNYHDNSTPQGLFTFNKKYDLNKNHILERNEIFGLGKKTFDLNKEEMNISFYNPNYVGRIIFQTWTSTGDLIGETEEYIQSNKIIGRRTGPERPTQGDFMDNLKGAGPGDYRITATTDNQKTYSVDVTIVE